MPVDPGFVDANVLVYAMDEQSPQYARARALLDEARKQPESTLYVTSQILCEVYSVITNARRVTEVRSPEHAMNAVADLLAFLHVLPIPARAVEGWLDLLRRRPATGADVFDLQIVASMLANGVTRIYTFNGDDFRIFTELTVQEP